MTNEEKINLIGQKILILSNNLDKYQLELKQLKQQLDLLQQGEPVTIPKISVAPVVKIEQKETVVAKNKIITPQVEKQTIPQKEFIPPITQNNNSAFNFEEFIGSKLITIIGIVILVIGIGIGVKYAIDNDMLGPIPRIVLAYAAGTTLLAFALKLKIKYKAFSAVLLGGGMASLYFTTYAAYGIYNLFPQLAAFAIMFLFTAFTVYAATVYALEVIGIIGLVGAYAVPMLLSNGSGKIEIMFGYMLIINTGILVLSFKKYWQVLNHVAFGLTWLIVAAWFTAKFDWYVHSKMMLVFSFLFFIVFYISNMSYKIFKHEKFNVLDIIRILFNSFIFFGLGYATLNHGKHTDYLTIFTILNALVHLIFSYIIFKNKLVDRKLFYLLIAMVLSFITIAIPIQFEGNWVTLFWSAEAVLLFTIGRFKNVRFYEWIGFIMIVFASFSLWQDWSDVYYSGMFNYGSSYNIYKQGKPFVNICFFTSLFVVASTGTILFVHHKKRLTNEEYITFPIYNAIQYLLPILFLFLIYFTFNNEISGFYKLQYNLSAIQIPNSEYDEKIFNSNILKMQSVALWIYNFIFFITLTILAIFKIKTNMLRWTSFSINILFSTLFILSGLSLLSMLTNIFLTNENGEHYTISSSYIYIRYVCFIMLALLLFYTHKLLKTDTFQNYNISKFYSGSIIHLFILVILSNELSHLYKLNSYSTQMSMSAVYKLGFTALWTVYSFTLIALGIFRKNRIMRISAIILFGITLMKLVTYDTWNLSTGYKVIAYMLLGIILLVVAFLYQKFKAIIFSDDTP